MEWSFIFARWKAHFQLAINIITITVTNTFIHVNGGHLPLFTVYALMFFAIIIWVADIKQAYINLKLKND